MMAVVVFVDVAAAVVVEEGDVVEVRIMLTGTSSIEKHCRKSRHSQILLRFS